MTSKMNKTVVVTMDDELYKWLNVVSTKYDLSKSEIIRSALKPLKATENMLQYIKKSVESIRRAANAKNN